MDSSDAYKSTVHFYEKPDGTLFGAVSLTEGTKTILPKESQNKDTVVDGEPVNEWKLVLVSTTKDSILGECDYSEAMKKLEKYTLDSDDQSILVKALTLEELESLL